VARAVPSIRTYRPVPVTVSVCVPPVEVVVEWMVVQVLPSVEVCSWYAVAYAPSQRRTIWLMVALAPRSTRIHCGSLKALDQRVAVFPSNAADAGELAFSVDDAVAGLPWESSTGAALATGGGNSASRRAAARAATSGDRRRGSMAQPVRR
jgi:hypothetical protein